MNKDDLDQLLALDAAGFLAGVGESREDFLKRVEKTRAAHTAFDEELAREKKLVVFGNIRVAQADRIPAELVEEAAAITENLYAFQVRHVPGFFLSRAVGLLWGGCLVADIDLNFSVFLIRNAFRKRASWLRYNRSELLAHELCHSVRQPLGEYTLEEYFAYQTGGTRLRRYFGNCFIRERDALLFLLPVLLLPVVQLLQLLLLPRLPVWPFWVLAGCYPAFLILRNAYSRRVLDRARRVLLKCGVTRADAVLFRCTRPELLALGALQDRSELESFLRRRREEDLRWAVMEARFFAPQQEKDQEKVS